MADVKGSVGKVDGVLVIERIHVLYHLQAESGREEEIDHAFEAHAPRCPVYKTLSGCIDITLELDVLPLSSVENS